MKEEALEIRAKNTLSAIRGAENPEAVLKTILKDIHVCAIESVAERFIDFAKKASIAGQFDESSRYHSLAREVRSMKSGAL